MITRSGEATTPGPNNAWNRVELEVKVSKEV